MAAEDYIDFDTYPDDKSEYPSRRYNPQLMTKAQSMNRTLRSMLDCVNLVTGEIFKDHVWRCNATRQA